MFDEILGHDRIKKELKNNIENKKIAHAYIFYGVEGIGKKKLAFEFAKEILNTKNIESCIDFKFIGKLEEKQIISVEQIRDDIVLDTYISPAVSKFKVYIIDEADTMNESAQNALLKTLEDPPSYVIIILITNKLNKIIPTILSRTKNIGFEKINDSDVKMWMIKNKVSVNDNIIKIADGSIGYIEQITNNVNREKLDNIEYLVNEIKLAILDINNEHKINILNFLDNVDFKNEIEVKYLYYLLHENNLDNLLNDVDITKRSIDLSANDDIQKTRFGLKIFGHIKGENKDV